MSVFMSQNCGSWLLQHFFGSKNPSKCHPYPRQPLKMSSAGTPFPWSCSLQRGSWLGLTQCIFALKMFPLLLLQCSVGFAAVSCQAVNRAQLFLIVILGHVGICSKIFDILLDWGGSLVTVWKQRRLSKVMVVTPEKNNRSPWELRMHWSNMINMSSD